MSDNSSSSSHTANNDDDFTFKFTESGGLTARYFLLSFDSKTNTLTSSTDISGSNLSHKPVPDSERQELKEEITKNDFFNYKVDYPPEKEAHTTAWTKNSKGIPDGITTIVDAIRRIAAKENVV
jgi:hypothetical protein